MPLEWMRTSDTSPGFGSTEDDFTALKDGEVVGRVMRIPDGPIGGKWMWMMIVIRPGPPFRHPRSGMETSMAGATRRVVEAYERLRSLAEPDF